MAYPAKTDREQILTAAMKQVEDHGLENLAIRSLAAALGLAPNALYRYFKGLADLESALAEEARRRVLEAMEKVIGRKGPAESIRALSHAYLNYAAEHPKVFALYLITAADDPNRTAQCELNTEFFLKHVTRVYGEKRAWDASHALWALLHGMAVLREAEVLTQAQLNSGFKMGLELWIKGADK